VTVLLNLIMAVRKWLKTHDAFDSDLAKLLPKYGVNNPDQDLSTLSAEDWERIKEESLKPGSAGKSKIDQKLAQIEKLWSASKGCSKNGKTKGTKSKTPTKTSKRSSRKIAPSLLNNKENQDPMQQELRTKYEDLQRQYVELKRAQRGNQDLQSKQRAEIQSLQNALSETESVVDTLRTEIEEMKSAHESVLEEVAQLQSDLCACKKDIESKDFQIAVLRTENEKLVAQQSECTEGQSIEDELNDQIALLNLQLKVGHNKAKAEVHRMQSTMSLLEQKLQSKDDQYNSLLSKYDKLRGSAAPKFKKKAVQYSKVLSEFNQFIEQSNEDREAAERQIESLRIEVNRLKAMDTVRMESRSRISGRGRTPPVISSRRRKKLPKNFVRKMKRGQSDRLHKLKLRGNVPVIVKMDSDPTATTESPAMVNEYFEDEDSIDIFPALSDGAHEESPYHLNIDVSSTDSDDKESNEDMVDDHNEKTETTRPMRPQSTRSRAKRKPKLRGKRPKSSRCSIQNREGLRMSMCIGTDAGASTDSVESD